MSLQIASDRLAVQVRYPEDLSGVRFDRTAFITQVTLDGEYHFCASESPDGSGGEGLCGEFGIFRPLGYEDASVGGWFPKIGVGWLQRTAAEPYSFSADYPARWGAVEVDAAPARLAFRMAVESDGGFGACLEKVVRVSGAQLEIASRLCNTGTVPIQTDEYVHNFLACDEEPFWPGAYELALPDVLVLPEGEHPVETEGRCLRWTATPDGAFWFPWALEARPAEAGWRLRHLSSGREVGETLSGACYRFHLFGSERLVSPELFVDIDVPPGAEQGWTRWYTFG